EIRRGHPPSAQWVRAVLGRIGNPREAAHGDLPLDVDGTAFQWQVWKALQSIPPGERRSYREVAESIGRPAATRAVARACARYAMPLNTARMNVLDESSGIDDTFCMNRRQLSSWKRYCSTFDR